MYSPAAIEKAPASRPAMPASTMKWLSAARAGDAHDQRQVADQAVVGAEDGGAQRARPAAAMPRLLGRRAAAGASSRRLGTVSSAPDRGVLALIGRDRGRLGRQLVGVGSSSSPSSAWTRSDDRVACRTSVPARMISRTRIRGAPAGGTVAPAFSRRVAQISAWRRSFAAIRRNAAARSGSFSICASWSYRTIASRSSLRLARLASQLLFARARESLAPLT